MSECSGHTCLPRLNKKIDILGPSFGHTKYRNLLFHEAPFAARVTFLFLVAEIDATELCFFCNSTQFFSKTDQNILLCLMQMLHLRNLFISKRQTH